jgi:hypothetical protein
MDTIAKAENRHGFDHLSQQYEQKILNSPCLLEKQHEVWNTFFKVLLYVAAVNKKSSPLKPPK